MKTVLLIALLIVTSFYIINSHGSSATVRETTGVRAIVWGTGFLVALVVTRVTRKITLPKFAVVASSLLAPIAILLSLVLVFWESVTPPNYIYSLFKLQPIPMMIGGNGLLVVVLLSLPLATLKKYGQLIIRLLPLYFLLIAFWSYLLPFDGYVAFTKEDGPIENAQFVLVSLTSLILFAQAFLTLNIPNLKRAVAFALLGLVFFFIAMEEISWGQRLFHLETPTEISQVNVQQETNIHNIGIFNTLQYFGYIGLALLGTLGGLMHSWRKAKWNSWIPTVIPFYLLVPAIYYIIFLFDKRFYRFAEIIELLFYAGVFIWVWASVVLAKKFASTHIKW